jgi:hypothetical protein
MQRILAVTVFALLLLTTACGGGSQHTSISNVLAQIQIVAQSSNLVVGQSQQMSAMGLFADGTTRDLTNSVSWTSSDSTITSITSSGMLTAKNSGQVVITATSQGVKGTFNLTIAPALVSIAVTPVNPTIAPSTTEQFIATGTYTDNSQKNITGTVGWASSATSVASISSTAPTMGLATAVSSGSTTVTATLGSISGSTTLTVSSASATAIAITPVNPTVALGLAQQFTAIGSFSDGSKQDITNVTQWQSSTAVVSITVSGLATARNIGSSTITGSFGGKSGSSLMTVNAANLVSLNIQPSNASIAPGTRKQFVATGTFNDGSTRDVTFLSSWTSSTSSCATIGAGTAIASALAPGQTTITATLGSVVGSTSLIVTSATITSVVISPTNVTIPTGGARRFSATGVFSDSSQQDLSATVTWASSNTAVATVGNTSTVPGFAVGVSAGTSTISATFTFAGTSTAGTTVLTVSSATLASIDLTPPTAEIAPASGQQYTAMGTFTDGSSENLNTLVKWSSANASIAIVSNAGFATGESSGVVVITAQSGAVSATANLLVEGATLTSIQVTPPSSSVAAGFETQLRAIGSFSNGDTQDLTPFVTWTSSSPGVATITNAQSTPGRATGVQPGSTNISGAFAGQVGTASLTVTNATLTSITITPSSASITIGHSQQFAANGAFSDGSTLDLTEQATWNSSNPTVATISAQGLSDALSSGTSTISASMKGVSDTAILIVQ